MGSNDLMKFYGLEPLTWEQEITLPEYQKGTRAAKIQIVNLCMEINNMSNSVKERARAIPEVNDKEHSEKVSEFYRTIQKAYTELVKAMDMGRS